MTFCARGLGVPWLSHKIVWLWGQGTQNSKPRIIFKRDLKVFSARQAETEKGILRVEKAIEKIIIYLIL